MATTFTTTGAPAATLDLLGSTPATLPQTFANPLSGSDGYTWSAEQAEANRLKREREITRLDKIESAILDPDAFFKKNPFTPAFTEDPEKARRKVLVSAYLRHENGGQPVPMGADGHELMRRRVAAQRFQGRGADDDDAFLAEITKTATTRRDRKEIARSLVVSATEDAQLPAGNAPGYRAFLQKARTSPGYSPEMEPDLLDAWNKQRAAVAEKIAPFKQPLQDVWNEFTTKGDITGAAYTAWSALDSENRRDFLEALALRARTLPDDQRETFLQNIGKATSQAVEDYTRQAGESQQAMALKGTVPTIAGNVRFMSPEESARLSADFTSKRNFAADVRQIFRADYDPLTSAFREGKPGFWENIAYQTPGVTATSLSMAVPIVGPGTMIFAMEGSAYESTRAKLLSQGMDDATATTTAQGIAPLIAAPQAALEKVQFGLWSRKLPAFSKAMDAVGDRIVNRALRGAIKTATIGTAETAVELTQDAIQNVFTSLADDLPGVDWSGISKEAWTSAPEIFFTMLPLSILGAAGGLSQEARNAAFARATPAERAALGITPEASAAIDAAVSKGPASLASAIDAAWQSRNPDTPEAKAAAEQLRTERATAASAAAELEKLGYAVPRFVQTAEGISVVDSVTNEEIGTAPDFSGALRIARGHTAALDDLQADQIAALGTLMEAARAAAELDPQSVQDIGFDATFDPEQASPQQAARYAAQVSLLEQAEGGTGDIARSVLGNSETTFAQGLRSTVNRIFRGGSVLTIFHENFHGLRRQAHAAGTLTRADEIALLRSLDSILAGKSTKSGRALRFIPEGMTDEQITDTLLDEAISEIAEVEILRTRKGAGKGKLGVSRALVSRNLSALARLIPGVAGKFSAFLRAVRAHWGLSLSRAVALKSAERKGEFDATTYDAFLNKLLGLDEQQQHDDGVRAELNRILGLEYDPAADDIPFSIGNSIIPLDQFIQGSKVVDSSGNPIKVFHGSPDIRKILEDGFVVPKHRSAIFFTDSKAVAETYADDRRAMDYQNAEPHVIPAYLSIKNPLEIDAQGKRWRETEKHIQDALNGGHDGIIIRNSRDEYNDTKGTGKMANVYAVFSNNQVKSAADGPFRSRIDGIDLGSPSAFSLSPAAVPAIMQENALARIRDPRRRTQVMSRIARDFEAIRLQTERLLALTGRKRSKAELRQMANAREDLRAEELIGEVHARFQDVLTNDDLTKIKSYPVHSYLADPDTPLRGRLMSKAAAIKARPDLYQLHRAGEYDGSDGVSRSVFGGQLNPADAAQNLYDEGLISEPTPDAMWQELLREQNSVSRMKEALAKAQEQIREAKAEAKREATEWLNTQSKGQETNFSPREEILRSLRMLDAILAAMPPEVRGKVGGYTQIARITTDEAKLSFLKDRLAKADKELETYLRAEFGKEFEDLMKRARPTKDQPGERPSGTIDPDIWEIFKIADAATHWKFREAEAEASKWDALADHEDTTNEQAILATYTAQIIRLTQSWETADAARREQAVRELESLYYQGLDKLRRTLSARNERVSNLRASAQTGTGKIGDRMEIKTANKKSGKLAWEFMSFGQVVNVLFGEKSAAAQWFNAREIAAANALEDAMQAKANALESLFESIAGSRFAGEKLRARLQTEESITVTDALGKSHTFTESEAITFLLMWRQEDGARHMRGIQDDSGKTVSTWAWNDEAAAAVESQLSPAGAQIMAFLGDSYGAEYSRINDVFRRIWHVSMPRHKMYAPLTVKAAQSKADTIMDPVSGDTMGIGMTPGSLKNRSQTAVAEPDFRDAFQVYLTHARQMEHFIAYGEFARDALAIVNRRETRNAIEAAGGQAALSTLGRWLDFFAMGGIRDANMGSAWMQALGRSLGRLSQAALVGRVSVLAMQSLQLAAAAYKMPLGSYLIRFAKLQTGQLSWGEAIRSPYIQRRLAEMPPVIRDAIRGMEAGTPNRLKFLAAKAARTIAGADALFTAGTYAIFYDYHLKQNGGDQAAAHLEAERLTDQVAQPTRSGARSMLELANAGNPAFRAFWNFSSDPRQKVSIIVYNLMRSDLKTPEKIAAASKAIAITWAVSGILQAVLRAVLRDIRSDEDDEILDERHWSLKRLALQASTGPLGAIPFFGSMIEAATYKATGTFMPEGTLLSAVDQAAGLAPKWMKGDFDALEDAERLFTGGAAFSGTSAAAASGIHAIKDAWNLVENFTD